MWYARQYVGRIQMKDLMKNTKCLCCKTNDRRPNKSLCANCYLYHLELIKERLLEERKKIDELLKNH